jgi:hypothetical protein
MADRNVNAHLLAATNDDAGAQTRIWAAPLRPELAFALGVSAVIHDRTVLMLGRPYP